MHGEYEELELDEEDDEILKQFLPAAPVEKRTLADLIMEKIEEKNAKDEAAANGEGELVIVLVHFIWMDNSCPVFLCNSTTRPSNESKGHRGLYKVSSDEWIYMDQSVIT